MTKLNQILAIEKDVRAKKEQTFAAAVADVGKPGPLSGLSRTYQPRVEGGDELPPESTRVQYTVNDVTDRLTKALSRFWDVTATKDWANTEARADVTVDDVTLIPNAPGTFLIWFEKQLVELRNYLTRLPTLDPAERWSYDENSASYRSDPVQTVRTRKVPKNHVLYEATASHPAQVQVFTVDEPEGDYTLTKFSGAIPETDRLNLLDRIDALIKAVKFAREEANQHAVTDISVGDAVFAYLFA